MSLTLLPYLFLSSPLTLLTYAESIREVTVGRGRASAVVASLRVANLDVFIGISEFSMSRIVKPASVKGQVKAPRRSRRTIEEFPMVTPTKS